MDIEEIKTLTELMVDHDLTEVMIRDGDKRIMIRRGTHGVPYVTASPGLAPAFGPIMVPTVPAVVPGAPGAQPPAAKEDPNLAKIASPMVGTFYAAADPNSPPFVRVGDVVHPDSVVCIIEAMKVFNEIKSDVSGTIESTLVQSGEPVEFGQILMTVRVT